MSRIIESGSREYLSAKNIKIGRYCVLGENVVLEENVQIGDYTKIYDNVTIKSNTSIGSHCSIGCLPSFTGYKKESYSQVIIGERNIVRDGVRITRSAYEEGLTQIGDNNIIGANAYIGHDCKIGNGITISALAAIAGQCVINDFVNIGASSMIHQKTNIGRLVMVGAQSKVTRDVPPFLLVDGNPAYVKKINKIGLERACFEEDLINMIDLLYKTLKISGYPHEMKFLPKFKPYEEIFKEVEEFISESSRGCCRFISEIH